MRTGCKCRNTFESITSTRPRSVSGRSWRKTDVQICVSVSQFQNRVPGPCWGATVLVSAIKIYGCQDLRIYESIYESRPSGLEKRFRIGPLSQLALEVAALVDENLPVLRQH